MLSQFESSWPTGNHKLTSSPGCLLHAYPPSIRFVFIVAPEVLNRNSTIDQMIDVVIYACGLEGSHFLYQGGMQIGCRFDICRTESITDIDSQIKLFSLSWPLSYSTNRTTLPGTDQQMESYNGNQKEYGEIEN